MRPAAVCDHRWQTQTFSRRFGYVTLAVASTKDRPHGLKYRLYLGRAGQTLVRYDNETGKGDHRHLGSDETEIPYAFSSLERLLDDFRVECERHGWRWSE